MMKNDNLTSPPRQRTSVAIQGIDRSSPDDIVKDGMCEELHNLRWKDNAWRPVHPHKKRSVKGLPDGQVTPTIIYKHPVSDPDYYIGQLKLITGSYRYVNYNITSGEYTTIATFRTLQKVSHFGNVLMFSDWSRGTASSFLFRSGQYEEYVTNTLFPTLSSSLVHDPSKGIKPLAFSVSENFTVSFDTPNAQNFNYTFLKDRWYEARSSIHLDFNPLDEVVNLAPSSCKFRFLWEFARWDTNDNTADTIDYKQIAAYDNDRWYGEHALFAALRMKDGSIINPSPLSIAISNNNYKGCMVKRGLIDFYKFENTSYVRNQFNGIVLISREYSPSENLAYASLPDAPISYVYEDITVSIPTSVNTSLIDSIALYSTRVYSSIDVAKIRKATEDFESPVFEVFNDIPLASQPFYLLTEKNLLECDIIDDNYIFGYRFASDDAELITTKTVYSPSIAHNIFSQGDLDYNHRLHLYDIKEYLNDSPIFNAIRDENFDFSTQIGIHLQNSNIEGFKWGSPISGMNIKDEYSLILSYHDYRVVDFLVHVSVTDPYTLAFRAREAMGNNIAYFVNRPTADFKYPPIIISSQHGGIQSSFMPTADNALIQPNRLQVSAPNNPFSFPFENSYSFGSSNNRIIAMQSAAIEMHEMKVGELPLYVFTEEGIFALVAGQNTLYASVAAINYDRIINPNTLAINGAIVYITEKGVHLLTSQGTQVISTPIHDANGIPPLDFLRTCKILWPKQYNEVVLHNENDNKAYVFNLDSGYWSTRTLNGVKLNTDELHSSSFIYDLTDEDESISLDASFTTRPIKLGNVEFKRLETIIPRMNTGAGGSQIDLQLQGSVDGHEYHIMRECRSSYDLNRVNPMVVRRTPFSAKYFNISMQFSPSSNASLATSITHVDLEWYHKFMRKMR